MPRKKILVTGADGMLGTDVVTYFKAQGSVEVIPSTIKDMNLTDLKQVRDYILHHKPDTVIHTAAYTAVDEAETHPELCMSINAEGTKNLAFFCREIDAELFLISTDYVFDGQKDAPYLETDEPNPLNVYGISKLKGEEYVRILVPRYKIIRTSTLSGTHCTYSSNFIESILKALKKGKALTVVDDQKGHPTFTFHLAEQLYRLLDIALFGIYHVTNQGVCSWYEFARAIADEFGFEEATIKPVKSGDLERPARRPMNSVLKNARLKEIGLPLLPHWREGLEEYHRRRDMSDFMNCM